MYKVIGLESKKVYAKGKYRCDCLRYLQKKYPYNDERKNAAQTGVYSEPLLIRKVAN